MECANYKAIKFVLDTDSMKKFKVPNAYAKIDNALANRGFEHKQGLEYVSKQKMLIADVWNVINNMLIELPWLKYCIKDISIKDTEQQSNLPPLVEEEIVKEPTRTKPSEMRVEMPQYVLKPEVSEKRKPTMEDDYIME